ncbi:MAG: ATP-binding protein [Elusimicrobia bacterium]|nr:ATP-binding protein [Elusimicrobiota bacterium]
MERQFNDILREKIADSLAAEIPRFTRRDVRVPPARGKACAVIGMRRAGKTTYLWQLLSERLAAGVPRTDLLYLSFEDERLEGFSASHLGNLLEIYYSLYPEMRARRQVSFFLDEIQLVPGWETFVRRVLDSEKIEIFLSGSSARLLSREVATSMRGRAVEALVLPMSLREYLRHHGHEPLNRVAPKEERSLLDRNTRAYLMEGGFPEALGLDVRARYELLKTYVDVVILRDVIERHSVDHPVALRWLVRHLLGNAAGTFSINKFYGDLKSQGMSIGKDTLYAYLSHLEDAFLIRTLSLATTSQRQKMVNPRKVYPIDPGLIPVFDRSGRANRGNALETAVLLQLDRRGADVSYVKTDGGFEVDFIARYPEGGEDLIQVCANLDDPSTRERETRALLESAREHPRAQKRLITLDLWPSNIPHPRGIHIHKASDWLMGEKN